MIDFAWLWAGLVWPIPFIYRWLRRPHIQQSQPLTVTHLPAVASATIKPRHSRLGNAIGVLVWTLLIVALMRPQWLGEPIPAQNDAREMMIAVDLSGSMEIADMAINGQQVDRLTMLKHVMHDFIERRVGDRLGLILFADTAYVQAPMTFDRATVQKMLDETVLRLIGERTAIGDAIALTAKRFADRPQTNKILILVTDGQNTAGNVSPAQALELAKYYDVKIYTIGVGAEEIVVDGFFGQRRVNPSRDLDENMLRQLADETGGEYFRARSTEELERIYTELDTYEPVQGENQLRRPQTALYHWPLGLAWIMLALAILQTTRRNWRQHG
ncbi:vWA domain-containing protein [Pseudidiomarina andamanensis]|uniref:VWA domain-containing protein n=1 Tax=Pseudidiomarina andamanensis TaxID=1940690 RepID=A0AA92EPB0_9GAMM|nr:VWA domain-containing protein [Pseudidiomarina andamanensis]MDS0217931.1 VWA domain-containing protein [Pseudidiomarina andamanensis]QGT94827.1 VWA domain-containing protein [Pseudidiomarina andamanensis]